MMILCIQTQHHEHVLPTSHKFPAGLAASYRLQVTSFQQASLGHRELVVYRIMMVFLFWIRFSGVQWSLEAWWVSKILKNKPRLACTFLCCCQHHSSKGLVVQRDLNKLISYQAFDDTKSINKGWITYIKLQFYMHVHYLHVPQGLLSSAHNRLVH